MYSYIFQTHKVSVILFLLIYLVKTIMLLTNKKDGLARFTKIVKVPEMIISTLFLVTGIYMLTQIPEIKPMLIVKIVIVLASIPVAVIAYKKANKALAILSLLMIISAYGLAEMSKKRPAASKTEDTTVLMTAEQVYKTNCALCHGDDGKLGLTGATDLSASQLDETGITMIIREGKGAMAPFKSVLSEDEIKAVTQHVKSLQK